MSKLPGYIPADPDEAADSDAARASGPAEKGATPPDFEAAEDDLEPVGQDEAMAMAQPDPGPELQAATDEELEAELGRRRARTIDARIADAERQLEELRAERARLLGQPYTPADGATTYRPAPVKTALPPPAAPMPAGRTDTNPVTGRLRPPKVKPGSVPHAKCDCKAKGLDGCYKCMVI